MAHASSTGENTSSAVSDSRMSNSRLMRLLNAVHHISLEVEFVGMEEVVEVLFPFDDDCCSFPQLNNGEVGQDEGWLQHDGVGADIVEHH